jgi:5-carboxymethyl-2-hydroxymuconate isomerase
VPQLCVDLSDDVVLDRRAFALAAHRLVAELIDCPLDDCKTRFRAIAESCVGDGAPEHTLVVGEIRLLPDRSAELRTTLSEQLLALLTEHLTAMPGQRIHAAWDVAELDRDTYRRAVLTP